MKNGKKNFDTRQLGLIRKLMIRRIGSQVLVSFDHLAQAKSFFSFMKKRNNDAFFLETDNE